MCKVIAIANQKGGVGKTVTAANLGSGLARSGKKVLLIDSDSQGSLSISMGIQSPDKLESSLATLIGNIINEQEIGVDKVLINMQREVGITNPPLWGEVNLIPGNIELSAAEVNLVNAFSRETILRQLVDYLRTQYDYILIDCMPSLGMLTINALTCADSVLIPVQASYLPIKGLQQLISTIGRIKRQLNPKLQIEGILFTMVDARTNLARDVMKQINDAYSSRIHFFNSYIPMSVRLAETSIEGKSIYEYDPRGKAAIAYEALIKEVM